MKFWEWAIFISGLMSALVADSSIFWCLIFALICCFSLLMARAWKDIETDAKCYKVQKDTVHMASADDAWVGRCMDVPSPTSENITIWEMYQ